MNWRVAYILWDLFLLKQGMVPVSFFEIHSKHKQELYRWYYAADNGDYGPLKKLIPLKAL
jgi:hypothetical protein